MEPETQTCKALAITPDDIEHRIVPGTGGLMEAVFKLSYNVTDPFTLEPDKLELDEAVRNILNGSKKVPEECALHFNYIPSGTCQTNYEPHGCDGKIVPKERSNSSDTSADPLFWLRLHNRPRRSYACIPLRCIHFCRVYRAQS